jgi:hypothetical protein
MSYNIFSSDRIFTYRIFMIIKNSVYYHSHIFLAFLQHALSLQHKEHAVENSLLACFKITETIEIKINLTSHYQVTN